MNKLKTVKRSFRISESQDKKLAKKLKEAKKEDKNASLSSVLRNVLEECFDFDKI